MPQERTAFQKDPPAASRSVQLVFDGGAIGNPGKGYGSFAFTGLVDHSEPIRVEYPGRTTNNQAEYQTLLHGLNAVRSALREQGLPEGEVALDIWSDSQLVVEQVSGRWKIRDARLAALAAEVRAVLSAFGAWKIRWHPRQESLRILGH